MYNTFQLVTQNQSLVHQNLSLQETQSEVSTCSSDNKYHMFGYIYKHIFYQQLARAVSPVPGQNIELTQKLSQEVFILLQKCNE